MRKGKLLKILLDGTPGEVMPVIVAYFAAQLRDETDEQATAIIDVFLNEVTKGVERLRAAPPRLVVVPSLEERH